MIGLESQTQSHQWPPWLGLDSDPVSCQRPALLRHDYDSSTRIGPAAFELAQNPDVSATPPDRMEVDRVLVEDLGPEVTVIKPLLITIERLDEGYVASFPDANINTSGDDWWEALLNLRSLIIDLSVLLADKQACLGPAPRKQYEALRTYLSTPS